MSNSRVKTKKTVKRRLKIKGVLVLASVLALLFFLGQALLKVKVRSISVVGTTYVKDAEVIKAGGLNEETEFFKFSKKKVCENIKKNPLISTCDIKRKPDLSIEIDILENVPLFYYSVDSSIVLSDGTRMEGSSVGLPTLINLVPEVVLGEFISGLREVKSDIIHSISEIEYSPSVAKDGTVIDNERFIMSMNDGNTVYVNNRRLSNLDYYDKIYATIGDKKGVFNFDCDFSSILFKEYGE